MIHDTSKPRIITVMLASILPYIIVTYTMIMIISKDVNAAETTEFDFGTLTLTSLKLLGDAHLNNGSVHLTKDLPVPNSGSGCAYYSKPVKFRLPGSNTPASFSTFFTFSVTNLNPSSIGGGLAFVVSPDDRFIGGAGGFLGLGSGLNPDSGFVAVEFDTLMDVEFKDINGNHIGLDLGSMVSTHVSDLDLIGVDLKSGDLINAWIEYSGVTQIFNVSISYSNVKPKDPVLSFSLDLDTYLVSDDMFVGFTGSTQGSTETHTIEWWSFSSSFESKLEKLPQPPSPSMPLSPTPPARVVPPPLVAPSASKSMVSGEKSSSCGGNQLCKHNPAAVAGVVTASAFLLAIFGGVLFWVFAKKSKLRIPRHSGSCSFAADVIKMPKEFSYKELKCATKGFDPGRVIGHGAFGTVYKGILPETGDVVAVKRCSNNSGGQGKSEFLSELSIIGTLRHRNLVRLQGWCHEKGEILLVYDLMPNGSLDKALFESRIVLSWPYRRKILLGVASAMAYLHQECENLVVHRDVKTSNIMLDEAFNARLGDFGLARQMEHDKSPDATVAAGTMGYLAPEYLLTGRATDKTDVFSYGAVVLEVASGRRPIEKERNGGNKGIGNLVEWVWGLHNEGKLLVAADEKLNGEFDEGEMRRVLLVGLACSHPDPIARPTMRCVVQMLVGEAEVPIVPRAKPSMSFSTSQLLMSLQDSVSDCNAMLTISTSSSSSERNLFLHGAESSGHGHGDDLV